ncbi:unnamed protein product [Darwinula stevensoni]|uniref:Ras-related protein Rab-33B n=1 Tax=Darwinula stevensoni TaxID=69355 RepID=A0A7R8X186_9CRUS|nr:unnamed protein product [Darwinula stevensoni]CAG0879711.1 unnamed protein product [Darwinula stevensoni]
MALVAAEGGRQEQPLSFAAPAAPAREKDAARSSGVESEKRTESQPHVPKSHSHGKPTKTFKIIVIGDSNVGKTCLTFRFCNGRFPSKTEATIGVDFREKVILVNGEPIKLQLWDTAGQERFRKSMVPHYYRNVHAVVFVYDITKIQTFESLPTWIEECNKHQLTYEIPRILVGNKCDCKETSQISTQRAQRFADVHNMPWFETSAKDDSQSDHVESIFLTLAVKLRNSRPMLPEYNLHLNEDAMRPADVISVRRSLESADALKASEGLCAC